LLCNSLEALPGNDVLPEKHFRALKIPLRLLMCGSARATCCSASRFSASADDKSAVGVCSDRRVHPFALFRSRRSCSSGSWSSSADERGSGFCDPWFSRCTRGRLAAQILPSKAPA